MKLATKKLFHNILAVAVSACMVFTMTPALAWGAEGSFLGKEDGTATGSTEVKAKVVNPNFKFDTMTPDRNYESKQEFVDAVTGSNPLEATFPSGMLPDNYTVEWWVQEVQANPNYDPSQPESADNPKTILVGEPVKISSNDYAKADTPTNGGVPTFTYPSDSGVLVAPSDLPMNPNGRYEFSVILTDKAGSGDPAHATTQVSLLPDYPEQIIQGTPEGNEDFSVWGDIYQDFKLPPSVSVLEVTPVGEDDKVFQDIKDAAASKSPAETVERVDQLVITNNGKPDDKDIYEGPLEVRVPLPDSLKDPAPNEGDKFNVYIADDEGNVKVVEGVVDWAVDEEGNPKVDENGNKIPVIVVEVENTGEVIGSIGVGIPVGGTYNVTTVAQQGGMITPASNEGATIKMPMGSASTFSTYAITPGYLFTGFEMKVGTKVVPIRSADLGYNNVTINPGNYADITEDSHVTLTAKYIEAGLGIIDDIKVSASLTNESGAGGNYKVSTLATKEINGTSVTASSPINRASVDAAAGLLLEFLPNSSSKVKSVTINGKPASFQGDSLMLGASGDDLNIQVVYERGQKVVPGTKNTLEVAVSKRPNGNIPAKLYGDNNALVDSVQLEVNPGGHITVRAQPQKDEYILKEVLVYSPKGSTVPTDIYAHVSPSPNTNASGYPADIIDIYNVVNDIEIELKYELAPGKIETNVEGGEGGDWGWIIPPKGNEDIRSQASSQVKARAYSASVSPLAADDLHTGSFNLLPGERARLIIYPRSGYELSDVLINGDPVKSLLKEYVDNAGKTYYAMTVYRGETGTAGDAGVWTGDGFSGEQVDQVYYASGAITATTIKFSPSVIPAPSYVTVFTSVTDFGGGAVTPNLRIVSAGQDVVDAGKAVVQFFPDDGYKVDTVWIDDEPVNRLDQRLSRDKLTLTLTGLTQDTHVRVAFAPGDQENADKKRYSISATAGAGGSITPAGNFQVYEGSNQTFAIVPSTGYSISTVTVNGEVKKADDKENNVFTSRNTISLNNISQDMNVQVTFEKAGSSVSSTYTVSSDKEGRGSIHPGGALIVGAGASVPFSVIPENGWYVKEIRVTYLSSGNSSGVNMISLYDKDSFTFTLPDVRSDAVVKAIFAEGENGKIPGTGDPDDPNSGEDLPKPPSGGDLIEIDPGNLSILPSDKPGAVVSPAPSELEIPKEPNTNHAAADQTFTVTVADGYELVDPGIVVKDGDNVVTDKCEIVEVGDGVFVVTVPKEYVTENLKIEVTTQPKTQSTVNADSFDVNLSVAGDGYITPGMQQVGDKNATVKVERGKGQTFNFIPADGWKLFSVYVNGKPTTITGNVLTVPNIQQETTIEAAFSKLGENEPKPDLPAQVSVVVTKSGEGRVSPMATRDAPIKVFSGSNLTVNVEPAQGWKASATVDGTAVPVVGNTLELTNITKSLTNVEVKFEQDVETEYRTLTVSSSGPGTTSPAGTSLVVKGKQQTITLIPDAGKKVKSVYVDGQSRLSSVNASTMSLDLGAINANTKVAVEFCDPSELGPNDPGNNYPPNDDMQYFSVNASVPNGGGVLSPGAAKVAKNGRVVMTALPNNGYVLSSITIDGKPFTNIADNTFTTPAVTANMSVVATFVKKNAIELDDFYSVFVSCSEGGTVSPSGYTTVPAGGSQTITILPEPGYKVKDIAVKGQSGIKDFNGSSYTIFNITEDKNVYVTFTKLANGETGTNVLTHDITTSATMNGRISPEGVTKVADGKNASFTFVPDDGCKLSYVRVDGTDIPGDAIVNNQYIFTNVKENHSLHAVFIKDDGVEYHTVTVGRAPNGTITPADRVVVENGMDADFSVVPFYGYRIKNIWINNVQISNSAFIASNANISGVYDGVTAEYGSRILKLRGVQKDVSISASFEKDPTYYPGGDNDNPNYVPITGGVESNPPNSGAGGTTSIGPGGYMEEPGSGASDAEKYPQITITPNPGSMIDKVEVTYGDGSKTVVEDDGTYEYDENGNLLDKDGNVVTDDNGNPVKYPSLGNPHKPTNPSPTTQDIYEQGYITIDGEKAGETGGVNVDVTYRPLDPTQSPDKEIINGQKPEDERDPNIGVIEGAVYYEINATYSGGGRMYPDGRVKVAQGQNMIFQMLPSAGYELASLTVNGSDAMGKVTDTRKYIFEDVQDNGSINAAFGFINNDVIHRYKVTASSNLPNNEGVSPTDVSVPEGADSVVYFLPPDGQKVANVKVTKNGGDVLLDTNSYTQTMYTATSIDGDIHVEVTYEQAGEGDYTWTVDSVRVTSEAANGNGSVSPSEALVPAGSPQTFFFSPDAGYVVDYVMFNGVATTLKNNPASFTVTPSPAADAENKLMVYFREATSQDKQFTTLQPTVLPDSDGKVHATAQPSSMSVEVGSSVDFYVSPDSGYTIDSVKVDGWDVPFRPALPEGVSPTPGAEYTTYIVTIDNVQPGAKVEVTTKTTSKTPVQIKSHKLTITGTNTMYSPMGVMEIPEGGKQNVTINPLPGYYLDSVMATEYDANGNVVGEPVDITDSVVNNGFSVVMGSYDKKVEIKYLEVGGDEKPTPAYITLGTTKMEDGRDVYATISMQRQGEELVNVLTVDPVTRKLLDSDGNPVEFVRGGTYTFYASAEPLDEGKQIILSGASYNGNAQNVPNLTGMIANLKVNANGVLDLVFRELKDGEKPIVTQQFNVRFEVVAGQGSINPSTALDGITVPQGNSTGPINLTPENDHWMIGSVVEFSLDKDGNKVGTGREIDARRYKDETYDCRPLTNTLVEVTFVECALVDVQWDKSLGFVAPNPATQYLKLPVADVGEPYQFYVAPFEDCYVDSFDVTPEGGQTVSRFADLKQTQNAVDYLAQGGLNVVDFTEGGGVTKPAEDEGAQVQAQAASSYAVQARSVDKADIQANGFVPAAGTAMQNGYEVDAMLDPVKTTVRVGLYTTKTQAQYYTITPSVIAGKDGKDHGKIVPGVPVTVSSSDVQEFSFVPESSSYVVTRVLVDGNPIENSAQLTSYTFTNVDHDTTIAVEFGPRTSDESSRLLRVASSLARTGDLTGPVIGFFLMIAGVGLLVTAVSYIRRRQRINARR